MNQKGYPNIIIAFVVVVLLSGALLYFTLVKKTEVPTSLKEIPKTLTTMPVGGPSAASNLAANVGCRETELRKGIAKLSWTVATKPSSEQRIVVTVFRDSFESGKFKISAPLPSDQSSLEWDKLEGQAIHFWKVLTLQPDGWVASETAEFEGPTCVTDFVR